MESKPHIAYLSYDGLTDPLGQSQILPYLYGLSDYNFTFTIISFEKKKNYEKNRKEIDEKCKQKNISWLPLVYHKNPPVVSTLYDIWILWRTLKKLHQNKSIQIIHCRSYITSLVGLRARQKWKIPFIFDMRGFWADERVEGKLWNIKNPLYKFVYSYFKRKEKQFLNNTDYCITLTQNAKNYLETEHGVKTPIAVIPTCVDVNKFNRSQITAGQIEKLKHELGIQENTFLVVYLGSLGTWYLSDLMWSYFNRISEEKLNCHLLILTQDQVIIPSGIQTKNITIKSAPHSAIPGYLSIANLGLCFILPTFSKIASSATKIQEFIAMGVPVITNKGWGDVNFIGEEINETLSNEGKVYELVKITDKTLNLAYFSLEFGIKKYSNVYVHVLKFS
jgi:glycosyltransferase involved in cell wall biosynthesis